MSTDNPLPLRHLHYFLSPQHGQNEKRVWMVIALTASMMTGEIVAGIAFGSMALLADGWHMFTHAGALTISALAYGYARRHVSDARFCFGTGKVGELAGFTSAVILAIIALAIGYESVMRLVQPVPIAFDQAIAVAVLGLVVNLLSVWLLHDGSGEGHSHHAGHRHGHDDVHAHEHRHDHPHEHSPAGTPGVRDSNLRSAYLHVIADAATSVLAIVGLLAGRLYGLVWMDALMGIVGALVIARWSYGLLREAGAVLLDMVPNPELANRIRGMIEAHGGQVSDLHLWQVGPGHYSVIVSMTGNANQPPSFYKSLLAGIAGISHVTVEIESPVPGSARP
ncbi:MAG: CDF family Co(II)/Ni(II) efflux transporter DmeF [Burkholderiales bacterium]